MKLWTRILIWAGVLLLVCFVGLFLAAKALVTPERVRQAIIPVTEKVFDRPVEIGAIDIDFLSGISLGEITLPGRSGKPLLQVDKVVLRYRLLPLLGGRLMIDQVRLENPLLRLQRENSGNWNLAELLDQGETGASSTLQSNASQGNAPAVEEGGRLPFDLLVKTLEVNGGQLEITDRKLNPKAPYRFNLQDVSLKVENLSLDQPFPVNASLRVNKGRVELSGRLDPQRLKHDLLVRFADVDLAPLAPYFRDLLPGIFSRAHLQGSLQFIGRKDAFSLGGDLALQQVFFEPESLPRMPIRNAALSIAPDIKFNSADGLITLGPTRVGFNAISATVQGTLDHFGEDPRAEVRVSWQELEVRDILNSLPGELLPRLEQLDAAGKISGSLGLRGKIADPGSLLQAGDLSLDGVQFNLGQLRPSLSGTFELVGHGLASRNMQLRFGDESAKLQLAVKDVLQIPVQLQSRVTAEKFNLDKFLPLSPSGEGEQSPVVDPGAVAKGSNNNAGHDLAPPAEDEEPGPVAIPLVADGSVAIDQGIVRGLEIANIQLAYHFADNVLDIRRLSGDVAGGRFSTKTKIDLGRKGYVYQSELELLDVAVAPLLKVLQPDMEGALTGLLSLQASFSGAGMLPASMRRNLRGEGHLQLTQGVASGTKLSRGLVALLGLDQLQQISIQQAEGNFQLAGGIAKVKGVLAGRDLRMAPDGLLELGGNLALALPTSLSAEIGAKLDQRGILGKIIKDDQGWTLLPLKVEGTFSDPKVTLDSRELGRMAEKKLKQKLENKLLEKLAPTKAPNGKTAPSEKLLKDTLRGLLGK